MSDPREELYGRLEDVLVDHGITSHDSGPHSWRCETASPPCTHLQDLLASLVDAVSTVAPWALEPHAEEHGEWERKSDRPFDPEMDYVQETNGSRHNVRRFVTPWTEVA